jgi:DNA-binding IclR family transcriptional regulator
MLTLRVDTGSRARIATTAFGRALLAALPAAERPPFFEHMQRRHGDDWPRLQREVEQGIREVERRGFNVVIGLWQPDINAVAVPLVCPGGKPVLSIGCAGFARHLTRKRLEEEIGPRLVALAREIRQELAHRG